MKIPHFQIVIAAFCFATTIAACGNDDPAREAATTEALEATQSQQPIEQTATTTPPDQQTQPEQQPQLAPTTPMAKAERAKTAGTLKLNVGGGSVTKGGETCVAVSAKNFKSVVSMQYSIKWDPKVLKFKDLKGFSLPGLNLESFGKHILNKGLMTHSWYDATIKGINKGDGETLYEICFEAVGDTGSKSAIQIVDAPTVIEIANANSEFFSLDATPGTVLVK